jgi:hypothetical protein
MRIFAAVILVLSSLHLPAGAQASKPQGFEAFRLVLTRNVFDPDRRAMPGNSPRSSAPAGTIRSSVTLTGTMVTSSKSLGFFTSTRSEYNKVASLQESVGDYKVLNIEPHQVTLEHAGQTVVLGVGKQLPLAGTEPAPAGTLPAGTTAEPGAAAPIAPLTAPASGPTSDKDEILRRMMQRRQQEMSR